MKQLILAVLSKAEAKQSVARDSKLTFAAGPRTADTSPLLNLIKTLALLLTDTEMPLPFFVVDAFVDPARPGSGNGAGVMLVETQLPPAQCLAISSAVGLSETAFVAPVGHGTSGADPFSSSDTFTLTWYTPTTVVNLCGHATLAAAAALRDCGNKSECISFHTASGTLSVVNGSLPGELAMRFPLNAPWRIPEPLPTPIATIVRTAVGDAPVVSVLCNALTRKLVIRLADGADDILAQLPVPSAPQLLAVDQSASPPDEIVRGVAVTCRPAAQRGDADGDVHGTDFVSRYFSPWNGVPEDPVNGSSHTLLCPYWADVLRAWQPVGVQRQGSVLLPFPRLHAVGRAVPPPTSQAVEWEVATLRARQLSKGGGRLTVTAVRLASRKSTPSTPADNNYNYGIDDWATLRDASDVAFHDAASPFAADPSQSTGVTDGNGDAGVPFVGGGYDSAGGSTFIGNSTSAGGGFVDGGFDNAGGCNFVAADDCAGGGFVVKDSAAGGGFVSGQLVGGLVSAGMVAGQDAGPASFIRSGEDLYGYVVLAGLAVVASRGTVAEYLAEKQSTAQGVKCASE